MTHSLARLALAAGYALLAPPGALGQGVTTAAIGGYVTDRDGAAVAAADILVANRSTGFTVRGVSHESGRYLVQGLEVGGPYIVTVRRIGFRSAARDGLTLTLGQTLRLDFELETGAAELPAVTVLAEADPRFSAGRTGVGALIADTLLHRLPTVNRDLYSFVQLIPQMTTWYGPSGGGVNYTFNSILVDGASEQALFGGNPAGGVWGAKPISIEAVREYQVLVSPYDVRRGNFAGAQINAVTRTGTNDFRGTGVLYWRNETLARDVDYLRSAPYERLQFAATAGGPILRDRVHFFAAAELQDLSAPALGPYVGQQPGATPSVPVDTADISRFVQLLAAHGLAAGSAGPVTNTNPTVNVSGRVDLALARWRSRAVLRHNYSRADTNAFSRPTLASPSCRDPACFPLSSVGRTQQVVKHATVLQLVTSLANGTANEVSFNRLAMPALNISPSIPAPLVVVRVPNVAAPGTGAFLQAGSAEFAQGGATEQRAIEVAETLTLPVGQHLLTLGAAAQWFRVHSSQVREAYGVWRFASLDSLAQDVAASYTMTRDLGGGDATVAGSLAGFFAGDLWRVSDRMSVTVGARVDVPRIGGTPPYSRSVDSIYGRRTDILPSGNLLVSPRIGFNWSLPGRAHQLRGGAGFFAGRPPAAWLLRPFQNYGDGLGSLRCGVSGQGPPPPFPAAPDYRRPPTQCANATGPRPGAVNLLDRRLVYPQTFRASVSYDRALPWASVATAEVLYTRGVHDFFFVNSRLRGPVATDRHGRLLYGTIAASGISSPALVDSLYPEVIELRNQSRNYSYSIGGQVEKRFSNHVAASVAYSYSHVRDVQTHLYLSYLDAWQFGRVVSGDHGSLALGTSDFDQPHRVVVVGSYTAPWHSWRTDVSLYYLGTSGVPYTYVATGSPGVGDLNADGSNANDPIYVPRSAADTAEILFQNIPGGATAVEQQSSFEAFVTGTPCLDRQRGSILERNSCRTPWIHTLNVAVRQFLPPAGGGRLAIELQVFNLLNLLNQHWGQLKLPSNPFRSQVALLRQVGQTPGPASQSQPVFQFDPATSRYDSRVPASNYQIQLAARVSLD